MKKLTALLTGMWLGACSIQLTVYPPHASQDAGPPLYTLQQDPANPGVVRLERARLDPALDLQKDNSAVLPQTIRIRLVNNQDPVFGRHSGCFNLSGSDAIGNYYGSLLTVLAREIQQEPQLYFTSAPAPALVEIAVLRWELVSNDQCFSNTVALHFDIQILESDNPANEAGDLETEDGANVQPAETLRPGLRFSKEVQMDSWVTDLYLYSIIWSIPTIIHSGFRGNRQDQMNQLGRTAIQEFFISWAESVASHSLERSQE
ncbi:MAG: hypothetical protein KDK39_18565 [Leptospiraceae bacterium]|nr:hypothetical protein [Leptospiraceae bacterium]